MINHCKDHDKPLQGYNGRPRDPSWWRGIGMGWEWRVWRKALFDVWKVRRGVCFVAPLWKYQSLTLTKKPGVFYLHLPPKHPDQMLVLLYHTTSECLGSWNLFIGIGFFQIGDLSDSIHPLDEIPRNDPSKTSPLQHHVWHHPSIRPSIHPSIIIYPPGN